MKLNKPGEERTEKQKKETSVKIIIAKIQI